MTECVFCRIVHELAPAKIIARWPDAVAFVPLNPVVEGHVLVVPSVHVMSFLDEPIVSAGVMFRAATLASRLGFPGEGANLITSAGESATQTVFHMHVHLIPREDGDNVSLPWDVRDA